MILNMTTHEILTEFSHRNLSLTELLKIDKISRVAMWKTVERLRRNGHLRIAGLRKREKIYAITLKGLDKLKYLDVNGNCPNPYCSCQKAS